jgi:hypothetical protein
MPSPALLRKGGEPGRNRTFNLQIKSLLLCQLSYGPTSHVGKGHGVAACRNTNQSSLPRSSCESRTHVACRTNEVARPAGFEPAAFGSGGQRSIQLSYGRILSLLAFAARVGGVASLVPCPR